MASLSRTDLQDLVYDPTRIQKKILDFLASAGDGKLNISDPTNPFIMGIEAVSVIAANSLYETKNVIRSKYPSLASKADELYQHLSDKELTGIFSSPAECSILFYLNVADVREQGYRIDNNNFTECVIPEGTFIEILGVTLTLLNDISVRLYDNSTVYAEQLLSENELAYDDIGALNTWLESSSDGNSWIVIQTKIKQVKVYSSNQAIVASQGFSQIMNIENKYCYSHVTYANTATGNKKVSLNKCHNEEYIDPQLPSVFISVADKNIRYKIPDMYLQEGDISGTINIDLYDTLGKMYLPINQYGFEEYNITLGDTGKSVQASCVENIAVMCKANSILEGGIDSLTLDELRTSIINNSTASSVSQAITDAQLEMNGRLLGYELYKDLDVVTERAYIALKSLPNVESTVLFSKQDVFFNTCMFNVGDLAKNPFLTITQDSFILKSNSIFKEVNGVTTLITPEQLEFLKNLSGVSLIEHLKTNKYFYNPYYYIINLDETFSNSSVYELDYPNVDAIRIKERNLNVNHRANTDRYGLFKTSGGYELRITLATNEEFNTLDPKSIRLQVKLPLFGGEQFAYINGEYRQEDSQWVIPINSTFNIDAQDYLDLTNGDSSLFTKKFRLAGTISLYIMSSDRAIIDDSLFLVDEIYNDSTVQYTVFNKEELDLTFGRKLEYIHNKLYNVYSERKFKKYTKDVQATYAEDVYKQDPATGAKFKVKTEGKEKTLEFEILHRKGDVIQKDGQPVILHKKGDPVLDEKGQPVVDQMVGINRYIDIMLLEYEFFASNNTPYINYRNTNLETIRKYLTIDLPSLNRELLENTSIKYKSYKTSNNVNILVNNTVETIPYYITPEVTLYVTGVSELKNDVLEQYKITIGNIINSHCDNTTIRLEDIKNDIKNTLGNSIASIKIQGMDPNNAEIITIKDKHVKLTLGKILDINNNNEYIVKYDIKIVVQYI